ncbi:hypothetical protein RH858_03875 [Halalkaliarchaeum sp. AArc-GB]|uniref:DUF7115 domain-containing protein n=1 Tax=Halalkaliarchaeum sp. AArc-GB TaxID=3074078 RepID=UPI00285E6779|nr:hypothetical protein [Halalkaliarchaeum sp. AArc-GB]MDR5672290.1 hypothetical protein [Halalkaliarchaeum sp. AArc-GB]
MSLPETLATRLDDEEAVATVPLGGDDRLVVTPSRTLVYRAEGLLSDESVEEYPHGAERLTVSQGRRKAKLTFDYGLDGERTVSIPAKRLEDALHPVLAGTLSAAGITDPGESALRTFRFSELTLIITSDRVVKHVGTAVWDDDYEEFHYDDVTDLGFEEGSVATSVVLTVDGRQQRFKAPNEQARAVQETLVDALCDHYDVASLEEFRLAVEPEEEGGKETTDPTDFGEGPDPLSAEPAEVDAADDATTVSEGATAADAVSSGSDATGTGPESRGDGPSGTEHAAAVDDAIDDVLSAAESGESASKPGDREHAGTGAAPDATAASGTDSESDNGFEGTFEPARAADGDFQQLIEEVETLQETVERQGERLDRQSQLIEQLIEELRRGR